MAITIDTLNELMATLPDPDTIPATFACGGHAIYALATVVRASAGTSLYDFSGINRIPIIRDLTLPLDVVEVRAKSGKVIKTITGVS